LSDVLGSLLGQGLHLDRFLELDGSPHDCFLNSGTGADGMHRIKGMEGKLPMVYGLSATRTA